ncbi:substrate-binding domain-containing protein [Flavobacteriaceae bacterium KMM 6898]|nr:substrate-binding domain-containing protein [Flavobacteriaceae bacterium KMM 6898]
MHKKYIFSLLFLFMVCCFSCNSDRDQNEIKIGFAQAMSKDDWRRSMNSTMKLQASLEPRIYLKIADANYDVATQIKQVEQFIADQYDVIIISPIQSKPITPVVNRALEAGIPVLVVDRKTENQIYTAYLGADNLEVGRNAAKYIVASKTKDSLKIVELRGLAGSSPAEERSRGFSQVIGRFNTIKIVATIEGDWEKESIHEQFRTYLLEGNKVDYVFAHNDRMARGAWDVARELGMENELKIIGVDGLNGPNGGIQMVKEGMLEATILYPTGGEEAIKLALQIFNKEPIAKNNILSTTVIDEFNADIMNNQFDKIMDQQLKIEEQLSAIKEQQELYYSQNNLLKVTMALLAIILSLAIYSIYSIFAIRKKNRQLELINKKITVQRNQIQKIANEIKVSNEAKLNFFTGLSHEFKTPLTLIMSSIESLAESAKERGSKVMNEVELIYNNSNRLLRLINNLLDFRKVEDRNFNIRASNTNIFQFSRNIIQDFEREAQKRGIDLDISTNNEELELYIDRNLMDKVYFNLLSNAFKFTPDNGSIKLTITDTIEGNNATIHIKDNGIGIPSDEIQKVFQPFFKGSNNRRNSSGIGLHLSKQFVDLHLGQIEVKSFQGTEFIISLFKGKTHFNEDQIVQALEIAANSANIDFSSQIIPEENSLGAVSAGESEQYTILIIEDNRDLSQFLYNKFTEGYEVILSDGTDGIEKALELVPDIIICDVNLPEKSGFEICETLKKDLRTSHIPTIILTALGNQESYIKGLESGADLYLTKPFSYTILHQSIKSLLYNRERLRCYYTSNQYRMEGLETFGSTEQQFVGRLNAIIDENMDNTDFSVEQLAEKLHISRVQLYRKIKAILGINISDYIGAIRLEKAKTMLDRNELTISEIAYSCGFSTPNYFSTAFKNKYGSSPAAFRKSF